ncbi:unnamed protein product [Cyprideis torosa]|uniref:limulus clotting factor C n=1 Tax=Cyprideis torosa TaxID=163714 RepID=A0A7R8ZP68_9CRUS|nr:unnamed protein product [Cyprideis torosa]CAG0887840.1 unnamed protein product [Cyprideis torosa]
MKGVLFVVLFTNNVLPGPPCPRRFRLPDGSCVRNWDSPGPAPCFQNVHSPNRNCSTFQRPMLNVRGTVVPWPEGKCPKRYQLPTGGCEVPYNVSISEDQKLLSKSSASPATPDLLQSGEHVTQGFLLESLSWKNRLTYNNETMDFEMDLPFGLTGQKHQLGLGMADTPLGPCLSPNNQMAGSCRYLVHCVMQSFYYDYQNFLEHVRPCYDTKYVTICCPNEVRNFSRQAIDDPSKIVPDNKCTSPFSEKERACGEVPASLRIHNGTVSTRGAFPWMAALMREGELSCGGILVSRKHILTAAHCVMVQPEEITVRLGEYDMDRLNQYRKDFNVKRIEIHPDYSPQSFSHDIAILALQQRTDVGCIIWRACLPRRKFHYFNEYATVTGWGRTPENTNRSRVLKEITIPIWTDARCSAAIPWIYRPERMLCGGGGDTDSCQGDSGGPLMLLVKGRWTVMGIVAAGIRDRCAVPGVPGVYTRIDHYISWVEGIIYAGKK